MTRLEALNVQERIHLPVSRVWELLTDWVAAPQWMPGVDSMEAEQLTSPGTVLDYRSGAHERQLVISELVEERSLTLTAGSGDVVVSYAYELAESSEQCLVRLVISVQLAEELEAQAAELLASIAESESSTLTALRDYAQSAP